ncbi:MAG: hypothetical protein GXO47_07520 [Chlorobi bacterium]|nr:hypothetical protein [Chlorobiota bacterium]
MKSSWGDIVYLLVMVVFFIISSIAKARKKNATPVPHPETEEDMFPDGASPDPFAGIFDEDEQVHDTKEPVFVPRAESIPVEKSKPVSSSQETAYSQEKEKIFSYDDSEEHGSFWDNEEFDLRRAVVFSEILKRPEI